MIIPLRRQQANFDDCTSHFQEHSILELKRNIIFQLYSFMQGTIGGSSIGKGRLSILEFELSMRRRYFIVLGKTNPSLTKFLSRRSTYPTRSTRLWL